MPYTGDDGVPRCTCCDKKWGNRRAAHDHEQNNGG